jgi:GNAT superfamily N-acetyltransferase
LRIRKAKKGDIEWIVDMAREFELYLLDIDDSLIQEPPPKEVFKRVLLKGFGDEKHSIFVAEKDGRLTGFADNCVYPEFLHGGMSAYLHNIFVREGYRGQGIGKALLDTMVEEAKARGAVAIHVPVKTKNIKAIEFYMKRGIREQLAMMEVRLDR